MERALRVISIERGHDPRNFSLLSFGGAGGLHAVDLARGLNIPRVIVPPQAATLSALGMLMADVVKDYSLTIMLPGDTLYKEIEALFSPLIQRGEKEIKSEGIPKKKITLETFLDMRYCGQSYELTIPFTSDFIPQFHKYHNELYGYANEGGEIEIVNLRVKAIGQVDKPSIPQLSDNPREDPSPALLHKSQVYFLEGGTKTPFYDGEKLTTGNIITGPAIILRPDTTVLIGLNDAAQVDRFSNLIIKVGEIE
jgi:N-methylhydantoinase A